MHKINSPQEFDNLVSELEIAQQNDPTLYQIKVIGLALLGQLYLWIIAVLAVLAIPISIFLAIKSVFLWIQLIVVTVPIAFIVITALFVKFDPPDEGIELDEEDAPKLFAMIEDLGNQIDAPIFHHVLITNELNAAVIQIPKFGFFGGTNNYLIIGLPLMQALTTEQLKSVLAHEFGHLSKSHARFFNWIYRQRMRLVKILDKIEDRRGGGDFIIRPFLNWYIPYFNAYSFPLARANEYEADEIAAQLTSPQDIAQALVNIEVVASYRHEKFWNEVLKKSKELSKPTDIHPSKLFASYFNQAHNDFHKQVTDAEIKNWLDTALQRKTSTADTHPSLTDRLSALQATAKFELKDDAKSTELLGDNLDEIVQEFDNEWRRDVLDFWQKTYNQHTNDTENFNKLQQRQKTGEKLTVDEQFERFQLANILDFIDDDTFIKQLQSLQTHYPNNAQVCFFLGFHLLKKHDEAGVQFLETAMHHDASSKHAACEVLRDYFGEQGNRKQANFWHQRIEEMEQENRIKYFAENRIHFSDTYISSKLPNDIVNKLQWGLKTIPDIKQAILVTRLGNAHSKDLNVLAFKSIGYLEIYSQKKVDKVQHRIDTIIAEKIKEDILVINFDGLEDDSLYKRLKEAAGARLV